MPAWVRLERREIAISLRDGGDRRQRSRIAAGGSVAALGSGHALVDQPLFDERQIVRYVDSGLAVPADLGLNLGVALARIVGRFELGIELLNLALHLVRHYVAFALVVLALSYLQPRRSVRLGKPFV